MNRTVEGWCTVSVESAGDEVTTVLPKVKENVRVMADFCFGWKCRRIRAPCLRVTGMVLLSCDDGTMEAMQKDSHEVPQTPSPP
jgi:hypothetical protein